MRGRPKAELKLTDAERQQLQAWTRRRKHWRCGRGSFWLVPRASTISALLTHPWVMTVPEAVGRARPISTWPS